MILENRELLLLKSNVRTIIALLIGAALAPLPAAAQVGFAPEASPFRPIRARQAIGFTGGYIWGDLGEADVGPSNGPFGGVGLDLIFGGPIVISFNVWHASLERLVKEPGLPPESRTSGPFTQGLTALDGNIQFVLTGGKTWHGFSPFVGAGIGLGLGGTVPQDSTGFSLGTKFLVQPQVGFRLYFSDRIILIAEARDALWRLSHPQSFLTGDEPILDPRVNKANEWTHHFMLRFGLMYAFGMD